MLSFGGLDHEGLLPLVPRVEDLAVEERALGLVETLSLAAEVEPQDLLNALPRAFNPPAPAYLRIEIRRHSGGDFGDFCLARLLLAARADGAPVFFSAGCYCDQDKASDYLRAQYGMRVQHGSIGLERRFGGIEGRIAADGRLVFDGLMERPETQDAGAGPMPSVFNLAKFEGRLWLIEESIGHEISAMESGQTLIRTLRHDGFGESVLQLGQPLPAFYFKSQARLLQVSVLLDPGVPAAEGARAPGGNAAA